MTATLSPSISLIPDAGSWSWADGELEVTDIFCGAGGSSLGLESVGQWLQDSEGNWRWKKLFRVTQAINHWDLAVEAHNANFPHADHDVHDIEVLPASRFRRTPILWASPECVHHAYCRGKKADDEAAMRSRATMGDVIRFTDYHHYDCVMVENVVEARLWCEDSSHGEKCSCGGTFDSWFQEMQEMGYVGQIVYFNSQFAFAPQSRDRMYCIFTRVGARLPNLDFKPASWCPSCNDVVRANQAWKKPTKGAIRTQPGKYEWGRYGQQYLYRCPHCNDSAAPAVLGAETIIEWEREMIRIGDRVARGLPALVPNTRKRIKTGVERIGKMEPMQVQVGGNLYERQGYARVWSVRDPLRTVTGTPYMSLVSPDKDGAILRVGGQAPAPKTFGEPMSTITSHDRQVGVIVPNMTNNKGRSTEEPMGAVTTGNRHMLISMRNNGSAKSVHEPAQTVTGGGRHHGLLVYNGNPGFVRELGDAAGTVTARDKQALLMPYYQTGVAHPIGEPASTVTSKDREALVITDADIDDCYFRMLKWPELLKAQTMHVHADGSPYQLTAMRRDRRGNMVELSDELRVKMIGNAVSSTVAAALGYAVAESLR